VAVSGADRFADLRASTDDGTSDGLPPVPAFEECDVALEWCENALATANGFQLGSSLRLPVSEVDLLVGVSAEESEYLVSQLTSHHFSAGDPIIRKGDPADKILLLVKGEASVTTTLGTGRRTRIATLSPGMAFGELAIVDRGARSADVHADTDVVCLAIALEDFHRLSSTHPRLQAQLLTNLLRNMAQLSRRLTTEVAARSG
jgi:glutaminase